MIDIYSSTGDLYRYDEETNRLFKNDVVLSSVTAEPVFSDVTNRSNPPIYSGIFLKSIGKILTRSGNIHPVSDINAVF